MWQNDSMEEVIEEEVGEVVQPEHGGGGEEGLLRHPEHGQGDNAADEEGEDCPAVQQGGGLLEGEEIAVIPVAEENSFQRFSGNYLPNMAIVPPGHVSVK